MSAHSDRRHLYWPLLPVHSPPSHKWCKSFVLGQPARPKWFATDGMIWRSESGISIGSRLSLIRWTFIGDGGSLPSSTLLIAS
jgi:hypothetical protein